MITLIAPAGPTPPAPPAPTAAEPDEPGEARFLIQNVSWEAYEAILATIGDGLPRLTYLEGMLELMSPGPIHEQWGYVVGQMVSLMIIELGIPCKTQGSTTIRNQLVKRGLEADQCYYLASLPLLRGKDLAKLKPFPPPDLAIEVEETAPLLPKFEVYAGLGVPEVWWHKDGRLAVLLLGDNGQYAESTQSRAFPFLPLEAFRQQMATFDPDNETARFRSYRDWVRAVVAPLSAP